MPRTNLFTSNFNRAVVRRLQRNVFGDRYQSPNEIIYHNTKPRKGDFYRFMTQIFLPLIFVLCILAYLFTYFFEQKVILGSESSGAYKINRNINYSDPTEIPMFGSSRAQGSFIPDSLGTGFFNYGIEEAGYNVMLMMLNEECKKQRNSPLIVLNFDLEGLRSAVGDVGNYLYNAEYKPVKDLLGERYKPHFSIPVIKYYGQFEMYAKYYMNGRMQLTKYANHGAYIEKQELPEKKFQEMVNERKNSVTTFHNEPALENGLFEIIQNNPNRFFVFVVAPYHQSYFEKYSNREEARIFLAQLNDYPNVRVFDFSLQEYADHLFMNTTHINYKGALIFNQSLRDSLRSMDFQVNKPSSTLHGDD